MTDPSALLATGDFSVVGTLLTFALLLGLLGLSASCSGSETALFSLTPAQLEQAAASSSPLRRLVPHLMRRPQRTLLTILLANTAVNTLLFAISYVFFHRVARQVGPWVTPVSGFLSVLLVVVGGEVTPKVLAVRFADRLAPWCAVFVRTVGLVAGPVSQVLNAVLVEPFARVLWGHAAARGSPRRLSGEELKALLEMSRRRGEIDRTEDRFLREIVDLSTTRVRDLMVPRVEVVAYDINGSPDGLRELMRQTRRKKVPVYDGSMDRIVGLVYAKMLFLPPARPLREVLLPVRFVPEQATCEHLLRHFRETRTQLAIVVDEYGGMAGLVTLEDVLEKIVGDIRTPEDVPEEPEIRALSDSEYDISGALDVRYWAEMFNLPRRVAGVATVGGLVTARLGRPAQVGDEVRLDNVVLRVTSVHRRRIERLHLRLLETEEQREDQP